MQKLDQVQAQFFFFLYKLLYKVWIFSFRRHIMAGCLFLYLVAIEGCVLFLKTKYYHRLHYLVRQPLAMCGY